MIVTKGLGRPVKMWVDSLTYGSVSGTFEVPNIEDEARQQLDNVASLPFIHSNGVAVMPDVHAGYGVPIGSVIATRGAIIPAAVGVDIGCGMNAVRTSLTATDLPDSLTDLRSAIEGVVPTGMNSHTDVDVIDNNWEQKAELSVGLLRIHEEAPGLRHTKWREQLGTLGGGNHFIEICLDESDQVWIMLHSGSRGVGNSIGQYYIDLAKHDMEKWFIHLPDTDLAYLPEGTIHFDAYMQAVAWAQDYALENRRTMMLAVRQALADNVHSFAIEGEAINCHHNYVAREHHFGANLYVTRKGAVRARQGDMGIIPGSMGQKSYIVRGKGNHESYCSCSHGAGRKMSRTKAKNTFTLADLEKQTAGVECRKDANVVDEIPGAYKDLDQVMANQADLVEIVHTLRAVLCVKGN